RQGLFEEQNAKEHKEQRCGTTRKKFHDPAGLWAIRSTTIAAGPSKRPPHWDPKSLPFLFPPHRGPPQCLLNCSPQPLACANQSQRFPAASKPRDCSVA